MNIVWHSFSIKISSESSVRVTRNYIWPLINSGIVSSYYVQFNTRNIRIFFCTRQCEITSMLEFIEETFLGTIYVISKIRLVPENLIAKFFISHEDFQLFKANELSKILVAYFSSESLNNHTRLTIAIICHFCWIKLYTIAYDIPLESFLCMGYRIDRSYNMQEHFMESLYKENKEFINHIWINLLGDNLEQIGDFSQAIQEIIIFLQSIVNNKVQTPYIMLTINPIIPYLIPSYINRQLGITKDLRKILIYFLHRTVTQMESYDTVYML